MSRLAQAGAIALAVLTAMVGYGIGGTIDSAPDQSIATLSRLMVARQAELAPWMALYTVTFGLLGLYPDWIILKLKRGMCRISAWQRRRWKRGRTLEDFRNAQAGAGIALLLVLAGLVVAFVPKGFLLLIIGLAFAMHVAFVFLITTRTGGRVIHMMAILGAYGLFMGWVQD